MVTEFIAHTFVPIVQETWETQLNDWGFVEPIHPDWDPDKLMEIIITDPPFALFGGTGTYHVPVYQDGRPYPQRRLWWHATNGTFQAYATLANAYRAVYAHEFFHLVQWNVALSAGCSTNRWRNVFIEAQGNLAPSVRHPELEMNTNPFVSAESQYARAANRFLTLRMNSSYRDLESEPTDKYDAALYWRFLYERYNGKGIVRAALEEMVCHYDPDIVAGLGPVMDRTFQRIDGPFDTFEESLIPFARSNYALRLENGRCGATDLAECRGLYHDPGRMYVDPPLEATLDYNGAPLVHDGAIPTSFGMDFVEVRLDAAAHSQPLTVRIQAEGSVSRLSVEIWKLGPGAAKPRALTPQPEVLTRDSRGAHVYVMPSGHDDGRPAGLDHHPAGWRRDNGSCRRVPDHVGQRDGRWFLSERGPVRSVASAGWRAFSGSYAIVGPISTGPKLLHSLDESEDIRPRHVRFQRMGV